MNLNRELRKRTTLLEDLRHEERRLDTRLIAIRSLIESGAMDIDKFNSLALLEAGNGDDRHAAKSDIIAEGIRNVLDGSGGLPEDHLAEKVKEFLRSRGQPLKGWAKAWKKAVEHCCEVADGRFELKEQQPPSAAPPT